MIIKEAVHFGLNRAMLARLGVMGCVSCGRRGLSTGQVILSRSAIYKMLVKDSNKRKKKHVGFDLPRVAETPTVVTESGSKAPKIPKYSSRLRNLNKVFLDNITDILSTGELASQLYGRGLELSQVSIHPNLQGINVYWVTTGNPEKDQETQELLNFHAKAVRHKLSNLRIIGHSPPIYFLRDDRQYKLQEVERLLAIADFGEDFEPTNPAHHLKADVPTLPVLLDTELKDAIKNLEGEDSQKEGLPDPFKEALRIAISQPSQGEDISDNTFVLPSDLPTMRGDVLGVNANPSELEESKSRTQERG
ncbi:putative ribosome-binding factor A, mitochondrial isoform X2 [Portunus trituberculatus]|uniref:putative ribosome-binding factor A, mitochondrial isoform X2 n=1 Tax=Portunus trituberculatus TaxID=210409 RepID=UPI001E1CBE02|nr:putative ribosome-binding factor A, mitochondrial isoform X2 [Portunus trituberculatus]